MSSRPRGRCIILNILNYERELQMQRNGSEVDVERLQRLFTQLGFEVDLWLDLTKSVSLSLINQLY